MLNFEPTPRRVALAFVAIALLLSSLYAATQFYRVKIASPRLARAVTLESWPKAEASAALARERIVNPRGVVQLFDMDAEGNAPAIWSVLQLILAAVLLVLIYKHARLRVDASAWLWMVLAVGFFFLALDEGASIHSSFYLADSSEAVRKSRGIFYFSWVIPALVAVVIVGIGFLRFLWRLPTRTRVLFLVSGAWYVASALGGEMAQGWWTSQGLSKVRLTWAALTIAEELGEMLSISMFIYALLDYMRRESITCTIRVVGGEEPLAKTKPARIDHYPPDVDEAELVIR